MENGFQRARKDSCIMSHWKRTLHMMPVFALAAALCAGEASAACYGAGNVTGDGLRLGAEGW